MTTTTNNITGNALASQPGTGCWHTQWEGHKVTIKGKGDCKLSNVLTHLTWAVHPATGNRDHANTNLYGWYHEAGGIAYLERVRNCVEHNEYGQQVATIDGSDATYLVAMLYEFAQQRPHSKLDQHTLDTTISLWEALALARADYENQQRIEGINALKSTLNPVAEIIAELG